MRIFEFNPGLGTFSSGFEQYGGHEVVEVQKITSKEIFSFNLTHKNGFSHDNSDFIDKKRLKKHDLAILKPNFGILMTQKRFKELNLDELWSCLAYLEEIRPKIAIIITPTSVISPLNMAFDYVTDGFGMVSKDIVVKSMQKSDYMVWQLVVDQVQCGVPMYYPVNFYVAIRNDLGSVNDMRYPTIHYGITRGKMPYTTILDALSDMPTEEHGDYKKYPTSPINTYQAWCRQHVGSEITHNEPRIEPQEITSHLKFVKQGVPLSKVAQIKENKGKRAILARPAKIGHNFHLIKGNGACIHPTCHRAFTIREGARLHGLQDHLRFRSDVASSLQAKMIHESISPLTAVHILEMLDPYT